MNLNIVSPNPDLNRSIDNIAWLELDTPVGNFIILPEHAPTILTIAKNSNVRFGLSNGKHDFVSISQGIASIKREKITILINE